MYISWKATENRLLYWNFISYLCRSAVNFQSGVKTTGGGFYTGNYNLSIPGSR